MQAFNRADVDRLASFYAVDAVNHQVAEAPIEGREAIRTMFVFQRGYWDQFTFLRQQASSRSRAGRPPFAR